MFGILKFLGISPFRVLGFRFRVSFFWAWGLWGSGVVGFLTV